jgi:nicotinate phosphoribosyltransferase
LKEKNRKTAEGILLTDQYQLTMAHLYYRMGLHEQTVQFDHFFRENPNYGAHRAGYCVNAGLEWLLNWMDEAVFRDEDIEYLRGQTGRRDKPVFGADFLDWLREGFSFKTLSMKAIPEGRVIHPNVPITLVEGQLAVAQILETSLLNRLNFQVLIATKAARILRSGRGQHLLEFGLRRGHATGANAGARAALIGGAHFTSNVGLSHVLGLLPKGTHAHSMVQVFISLGMEELDAFQAYADIYPDDCLLLVDTIDTLNSGVPNAIKVFEELKRKGHTPVGIRIDSGDLGALAIQAAKMLNEAGFAQTTIVLSDNLDELAIAGIINEIIKEAAKSSVDPDELIKRLSYGVGTKLITSEGASALGGVYKLVAVQKDDQWLPATKISDSPEKSPTPGRKGVWRLYNKEGKAFTDLLSLEDEDPRTMETIESYHPFEAGRRQSIPVSDIGEIEPLLVSIMDKGKLVCELPSIEEMRKIRRRDEERLESGVGLLIDPELYPVRLTRRLWELKKRLTHSNPDSG